jgi:hypothetical protein
VLFLDVSPEDIRAAEARRSDWEDEEDDCGLELVASCYACGNPTCRPRVFARIHVLCPACDRFMYAPDEDGPVSDYGENAEHNSGVTWDLDWDIIDKRLSTPPKGYGRD